MNFSGVKQFGVFAFSFLMKEKRESTVNDGHIHQESTGKAIAMPSSYSLCNIHRITLVYPFFAPAMSPESLWLPHH